MRRHLCTFGLLAAALVGSGCGGDTAETGTTAGGDGDGATQQYEGSFTVLESPGHGPQLCSEVATSYPPQCGGLDIEGWDWEAVDGEETANGVTWGSYHVTGTFARGRFMLTAPPESSEPGGDAPDAQLPDFSPACDQPEVSDPTQGMAQWEGIEIDVPDLVAAWVSDPAGEWDGPFVANLVVLPGRAPATIDLVRQSYGGALCVVERDGPTLAELSDIQQELLDADTTEHLGQVRSTTPDGRLGRVLATVWVADGPALDYVQQRWGDRVQLEGLLQPVS